MAKIGKGIQIPLSWVPAKDGNVPNNALSVTRGIYVVRCKHDGQWIPGKAATGHNAAYYPYGGEEKNTREYEVLCDTSFPGHQGYILSFSGMSYCITYCKMKYFLIDRFQEKWSQSNIYIEKY